MSSTTSHTSADRGDGGEGGGEDLDASGFRVSESCGKVWVGF